MARDKKTQRYAEQLEREVGAGYASKVDSPNVDNFASLDASGGIQDSGYDKDSFADASAVLGDTSAGRRMRHIQLTVDDGTDANKLKCTVGSLWNGDTIGQTDNVAKDATTGNFSLDLAGEYLTVEAAGLSGNVIMATGHIANNPTGTALTLDIKDSGNDILMCVRNNTSGVAQDLTALVDVGAPMIVYILYITSA